MKEIKFDIIKSVGIISSKRGWNKELNVISWSEKERKFDLRSWDENHEKMSKGITLTKDELISLKELLNRVNIDDIYSVGKDLATDDGYDDIFDE